MSTQNSNDSDPADPSSDFQYTYQREKGRFLQARIKLLVVEDDNEDWQLIQQALLECLPQAATAWVNTAPQALKLLEELHRASADRPQLVLMDLYLPTREVGLDLLKQLKGVTSPFKHIPVIVLSQSDETTDITECYAAGATAYTQKSSNSADWKTQFTELRQYWLETVTLPSRSANYF